MKLIREPLLHFAVAGAFLFGGYALLNRGGDSDRNKQPVRIGAGELRWLRETFASQTLRPPTAVEMSGLVETLVSEELLSREARALGLDRGDTVVRRRLAQKLEFVVADTTRIAEPDDIELRAFYADHPDLYRTEPRLCFEQVYFSAKGRERPDFDAQAVLTTISAVRGDSPGLEGDPLPLEPAFAEIDERSVSGLFGADFARAVFDLPVATWSGPVMSAFGYHLVRVTGRTAAERKLFEEVRTAVLEDWTRTTSALTKRAYLETLRQKYGVIVEGAPAPRAVAGGHAP
jgi:hypothetical protein